MDTRKWSHPFPAEQSVQPSYAHLSPFELKDTLIRLAAGSTQGARVLLDAGRGNPNWIATAPRDAFFTLGHFALEESRRVWDEGDLGGKPAVVGAADRLHQFGQAHRHELGVELLNRIIDYGVTTLQFSADEWVHELVDGILGDNYPTPDRMLTRVEKLVSAFLQRTLCNGDACTEPLRLFAVEGATAAMCYVFDTLVENHLLEPGASIALMVPIFPPYIEIPQLSRYRFSVVEVQATATDGDGNHTWQYPQSELDKLADPTIQALFLVNPSNPPSVAMDAASMAHLVHVIRAHNPQMMIISDDVYATFADEYRSILAELPYNTLSVYSFSKYFGCTGWRLGTVATHVDNVFDARLRKLPAKQQEQLRDRYALLSQHPLDLTFLDRMVADSRSVALNHTAGLSTPQQVQMALFAGFALLDDENRYKHNTQAICRRRIRLLYHGLGLPLPPLTHSTSYYTEFDLEAWSTRTHGQAFTDFLHDNYDPTELVFRLSAESHVVLLAGGGFHAPRWSVRVSLANLDDSAYERIGEALRRVIEEYVTAWHSTLAGTQQRDGEWV